MTERAMVKGSEIRESRQRMGLTQTALAERLGVTQASIQNWEVERKPPPAYVTLALAELERRIVQERADAAAQILAEYAKLSKDEQFRLSMAAKLHAAGHGRLLDDTQSRGKKP